jgi:hypothetical protein
MFWQLIFCFGQKKNILILYNLMASKSGASQKQKNIPKKKKKRKSYTDILK